MPAAAPALAPRPPASLLQIAGIALPPPAFSRSALVVVDAQREYRDGGLPLAGMETALAALTALLAAARAAGAPVIHVVHVGRAGGALFAPDSVFSEILPEAVPEAGEDIVAKTLPNAFTNTELQSRLARAGRKELIIAGFMTHNCVSATARGALDLGYRSVIPAAATATRDLPDPLGGIVPAALAQRACLAALADRSATVVNSAADIMA